MEGLELLRLMAGELRCGRAVAESVVLTSAGSVARRAGARMVTLAGGGSWGTVGGGSPEFECQQRAREVLGTGIPQRVTLDRSIIDTVCGGSQRVGIRRVDAVDLDALEAALACVDAGGQGWLSCPWDSECPAFSFAPVDGDLSCEESRYEEGVLVEPVCAPSRAVIFGGGHVGREVCRELAQLDFEVTVFDDRPQVALPENFPQANAVVLGGYQDILASVALRQGDYVVVMTHGHAADEDVVAQALGCKPRYLGCMGSRHKRAALLATLEERGIDPAQAQRVDLPIGLEIGAVTPAEIAVSVAARIIQLRASLRASQERPCPS